MADEKLNQINIENLHEEMSNDDLDQVSGGTKGSSANCHEKLPSNLTDIQSSIIQISDIPLSKKINL